MAAASAPGCMRPVSRRPDYAAPVPPLRPSTISEWPEPFDQRYELDWGRADYGRRLLREHLDQSHDGASRRRSVVAAHLRRLRRLLPRPPAAILDAGAGPGLYAIPLSAAGFDVVALDVNPVALRHARREARVAALQGRLRLRRADLRQPIAGVFDAALLIYYVLEAFPRQQQATVLRNVAAALRPGGRVIVEMRLRPDQLAGRLPWWEVVP